MILGSILGPVTGSPTTRHRCGVSLECVALRAVPANRLPLPAPFDVIPEYNEASIFCVAGLPVLFMMNKQILQTLVEVDSHQSHSLEFHKSVSCVKID